MKAGFLPQLPLELAFVESVLDDGAAPEPAATPARSQPPASTPPAAPPVQSRPVSSPPKAEPPAPKASPPPASPAAAGSLSFSVVESKWPDILARLHQADKKVEALVRSVKLAGAEGTSVILEVPSDLLKGWFEQANAKSHIEQCMGEVLGVPARLRCVVKGKSPSLPPLSAAVSSPPSPAGETGRSGAVPSSGKAAEAPDAADAEEDPMLRAALDLGGQIKDAE